MQSMSPRLARGGRYEGSHVIRKPGLRTNTPELGGTIGGGGLRREKQAGESGGVNHE